MGLRMKAALIVAIVALGALAGTSVGQSTHKKKASAAASKRGPRGPRGPRGFRGPPGLAGVHVVNGPKVTLCAYNGVSFQDCQVDSSTAICPAGEVATGGQGFSPNIYAGGGVFSDQYYAIGANAGSTDGYVQAYVVCAHAAGVSGAVVKRGVSPVSAQVAAVRQAHR